MFHLKDERGKQSFFSSFSTSKQTSPHKYVVMSKMAFFILLQSIKEPNKSFFKPLDCFICCENVFGTLRMMETTKIYLFHTFFLSPNSVALLKTCVFFLLHLIFYSFLLFWKKMRNFPIQVLFLFFILTIFFLCSLLEKKERLKVFQVFTLETCQCHKQIIKRTESLCWLGKTAGETFFFFL